jgi:hypothetical protein
LPGSSVICLATVLDQYLQTAPTAKDLRLSAHELPKEASETEMEHVSFPRHAFSTMEVEFTEWQEPLMKFPQDPLGFPKLAKLMDVMRCPEEHWSRSSGNVNEFTVG